MIKLLIVDDSALMRRHLSALFQAEGDFEIRLARNGREAVLENAAFAPDVVTLDINMPEMDGLTALSLIMLERPVPVVMVSSLTQKGTLATLEALNLGAVDYVVKPGGTISLTIDSISEMLIDKVRTAARARPKFSPRAATAPAARPRPLAAAGMARAAVAKPQPAPAAVPRRTAGREGVVVIGVSTGGPRTLEQILPLLPADLPWPVLVAQHMPAVFTESFAQRMDGMCALQVVEVSRPMALQAGTVYIAKGGADMQVVQRAGRLMLIAKPESADFLWHPSVELLGRSVLEHFDPAQVVAVMLTGMGSDGADAFTQIKQQGGRTIAESEDSCIVFGMPAELIKRGGASLVLGADDIARQVNAWADR